MPQLTIPTSDGSVDLAYDLDRPSAGAEDVCVLYAHGFASKRRGEKADFFRRRFLDAGLAFCRFDFRGHGESGGRLFDLSLTRNLVDMETMYRHLRCQGFERVVLMGSSMGGGCAAWYALR
ncbi:MAG: alpha/beta fold hydrolase, partial [Acidobacteriota bacterium]